MTMKLFAKLLTVIATALTLAAAAVDFPSKPVQLILPYGAGGPTDLMARIVTSCLSPRLKQPVVVLNRPGANGQLAAKAVKTAAPDGHTLLLAASAMVTDLVTTESPTFDPREDLEPITKLAYGIQGVFVNAALPINSMNDLIAYVKSRPGQLNYATAGIGSVNHLSTEALMLTSGIKIVHVPYAQGTGPLLNALMSGEVQLVLTDLNGVQAALDTGKVRLIAVLTKDRMRSRPNVPTVIESVPAMAAYTGTLWYGFFAPPKTPKDVVQKAHEVVTGCLKDGEVRASLNKIGYDDEQIVANTPEQFRTSIVEDVNRLKDIVQRANLKLR